MKLKAFMEGGNVDAYEYLGWVPCVSGHIDFGLMHVGLHGTFMPSEDLFQKPEEDKKRTAINYAASGRADGHHRRIVLQSWVDWKDYYDTERDGKVRVVVAAEVNATDDLDARCCEGYVLMYPKSYKQSRAKEDKALMDGIGRLLEPYESYKKSENSEKEEIWDRRQKALNQAWEKIRNTMTSGSPVGEEAEDVYVIKFYICSHGLVFLRYEPNSSDHEIKFATADEQYTVIRQAFYYLKYSLHTHKHHSENDALTTIVPLHSDSGDEEKAQHVSLKLIGQLKRELTRIKRSQCEAVGEDQHSALGIIGYLRSLIETCHEGGMLSKRLRNRESKWLEGVRLSFNAQSERSGNNDSDIKNSFQRGIQIASIFVALLSFTAFTWFNINRTKVSHEGSNTYPLPWPLSSFEMSGESSGLLTLFSLFLAVVVIVSSVFYVASRTSNDLATLRVVYRRGWFGVLFPPVVLMAVFALGYWLVVS